MSTDKYRRGLRDLYGWNELTGSMLEERRPEIERRIQELYAQDGILWDLEQSMAIIS